MAKIINFETKYLKRTAIFLVLVLFLCPIKITTANANSSVFEIQANNARYSFCEAEIATVNGIKTLKCIDDVIDGIYLDTVIHPIDASVTYNVESCSFDITSDKTGLVIRSFPFYAAVQEVEHEKPL